MEGVIDIMVCLYRDYKRARECENNEETEQAIGLTSILSRAQESINDYVNDHYCCHVYHTHKKIFIQGLKGIYSTSISWIYDTLPTVILLISLLFFTIVFLRRVGYRLLRRQKRIGTLHRRVCYTPTEDITLDQLTKQGYKYYSVCNCIKENERCWINYNIIDNNKENGLHNIDIDCSRITLDDITKTRNNRSKETLPIMTLGDLTKTKENTTEEGTD